MGCDVPPRSPLTFPHICDLTPVIRTKPKRRRFWSSDLCQFVVCPLFNSNKDNTFRLLRPVAGLSPELPLNKAPDGSLGYYCVNARALPVNPASGHPPQNERLLWERCQPPLETFWRHNDLNENLLPNAMDMNTFTFSVRSIQQPSSCPFTFTFTFRAFSRRFYPKRLTISTGEF